MKSLLKGTTLIAALFFFCNYSFAQNTTANTQLTVKGKTSVETSTILQTSIKTIKIIRGDGINAENNL